jgi:hypothetical protein
VEEGLRALIKVNKQGIRRLKGKIS